MSPEQACGTPADRRADVWAFGVVLFEMLTGKRAFDGDDAIGVIAAVVHSDPDWNALPVAVPPAIRTIIKRCLEKDRRTRIPDMWVVRFLMADAESARRDAAVTAVAKMPARRTAMIADADIAAGAVLAGAIAWAVRRTPAATLQPVRLEIVAREGQALVATFGERDLVISPDGTHLVYVAGSEGASQLMVRAIDQLEPTPLRDTAGARSPFISPDSHWIGFFTPTELKKVAMTGGPPITLCKVAGAARGASWSPDDTIIFATSLTETGLLGVPAGGGNPKVLTKADPKQGESDHLAPSVSPDGRAVLFTIVPIGNIQNSQVAVLDLETSARKTLIRGGGFAEYVDTGHLVYGAAGTLRAVRFDLSRLEVMSDPIPVVEQVMTKGATGTPEFTVSRQGTLVYMPGGSNGVSGSVRSLVWVNRQGQEEPIRAAAPRAYTYARLSPDGQRVALDVRDQENDIWIWDLGRETLTRFTFDPESDIYPVWTPDGKRIIYSSGPLAGGDLKSRSADGTGTAQPVTTGANVVPYSISPDATRVIVRETSPKTGNDLSVVRLDGPSLGAVVGGRV